MEATAAATIPEGTGWQFEPKWDGFRCLVFRDADKVALQSKSGQPLARYFPEVVAAAQQSLPRRCVIDGELVVQMDERLSFDALLQRIHPAATRVSRLAQQTPAIFVAFDLLVDERGVLLVDEPLARRRAALEAFAQRHLVHDRFRLSPATTDRILAQQWLWQAGRALDGIVAKRVDAPYRSGTRDGMVKVKPVRTADCVVAGMRERPDGGIGSLLLGLYGNDHLLHHVGFTANLPNMVQAEVRTRIAPVIGGSGFTGRAPGGPSRWSREERPWIPLRPDLVVEVAFDQVTAGRFRHGTRLLRWRPDKAPIQCTFDQLDPIGRGYAQLLEAPAAV